jgi:lysophospholipase L1-like esterase
MSVGKLPVPSGQIGVWGDSIVHGGNDAEKGGWVNRLKLDTAARGWGDHVFDLGLGGNNSRDVLDRIEPELQARRQFIDYVLVSVGCNDLTYDIKLTTPAQFQANLEGIAARVQAFDKWLYFMTMLPMSVAPRAAWAERNAIIRNTAAACGVGVLDMSTALDVDELPDGVHPDAAGHEKVFQYVKAFLIREGALRPGRKGDNHG